MGFLQHALYNEQLFQILAVVDNGSKYAWDYLLGNH